MKLGAFSDYDNYSELEGIRGYFYDFSEDDKDIVKNFLKEKASNCIAVKAGIVDSIYFVYDTHEGIAYKLRPEWLYVTGDLDELSEYCLGFMKKLDLPSGFSIISGVSFVGLEGDKTIFTTLGEYKDNVCLRVIKVSKDSYYEEFINICSLNGDEYSEFEYDKGFGKDAFRYEGNDYIDGEVNSRFNVIGEGFEAYVDITISQNGSVHINRCEETTKGFW